MIKLWRTTFCKSLILDYALKDHIVEKFQLLTEDLCLAKCNRNKRCRSVNYNRKRSSFYNCELNSATNQQYSKSYKPRRGWVNYEKRICSYLLTRLKYSKEKSKRDYYFSLTFEHSWSGWGRCKGKITPPLKKRFSDLKIKALKQSKLNFPYL